MDAEKRKRYEKIAAEVVRLAGGKSNILGVAHCATRLRLVLEDNDRADTGAIEQVDLVKGVFVAGDQLQIIFGTGVVNKVYDEFLKITGMTAATKDEVKAAAAAKQPLPQRLIKSLGDVFVPILPAIVASGLMMGLVEALGKAIPAFATPSPALRARTGMASSIWCPARPSPICRSWWPSARPGSSAAISSWAACSACA